MKTLKITKNQLRQIDKNSGSQVDRNTDEGKQLEFRIKSINESYVDEAAKQSAVCKELIILPLDRIVELFINKNYN